MSTRKKAPSPPTPLPQAGEGSDVRTSHTTDEGAFLPSPINGRGAGGEGAAQGTVAVTVQTETHIHNGKPCQMGQVIEVTRTEAQFLLRAGVISKIPARLKKEQDNG